jgi:putative endonuclease
MGQYALYFVTNWTNEVLYTGVTNDLERRVYEHAAKIADSFTKKYNVSKLVYYELYDSPQEAIAREKQIKKWNRSKKDFLVKQMNPGWDDLLQQFTGSDPSASLGMTVREERA